MGISGIGLSLSFSAAKPAASSGTENKIRQLEQRLEQLGREKAKAEKVHDKEKAEKLQKQIEELQRRIQLLRQQKGARSEGKSSDKKGEEKSSSAPIPSQE